jgi:putative ABC transport system substrate-binding protein
MASYIERRKFLATLLGGAAAWPLAAQAQQTAMPVIGFLHPSSPEAAANSLTAFRRGLQESGYVEGNNVAIEYRWAENQIDRLPEMAADLVRHQVAVIVTPGSTAAPLAAKAATKTIPIVFSVGTDPVKLGLVDSLNRPGGNATGVSYFTQELGPKRLGLLRELIPGDADVIVLANPRNAATDLAVRDMQIAVSTIGQQITVLNASDSREIDTAFTTMVQKRAPALLIIADALFTSRRVQLVTLATRHAIPAIYTSREFAEVGGLMSYGANLRDISRQVGAYTGRILKGAKPVDLPVVQPTKFEFVINLQTARALRLEVPPTLLARADEVIE